jgi:PAS domain S-box-containing protein
MKSITTILDSISSLEAELISLNEKLEQEKDNVFNSIVEISPNFTAIIQNEKIVYANSMGLSLLKCANSREIIGRSIYEFIHPNVPANIKSLFEGKVCNELNGTSHIQMLTTSGDSICLEASSKPFTYNNKEAVLIVGRDVTSELIQKQKLKEEENLRALILNSFSELIAFYEPNHKIRWMNDAAKKYYGITDDSYIGKYCYSVRFDADKPCEECPISCNKEELTERIVYDNDVIWLVKHTPLFDPLGNIVGYIETSVDITKKEQQKAELKEAEDKVKLAEQRYREIFNNSHESLFLLEVLGNSRFRTLEANPQFEKEVGMKREMFVGKTMEEATSADLAAKMNAKYQRCVDARAIIEEDIELQLPDRVRYFHTELVPVFDENGTVCRINGATRDITERKQLDELLMKRQKNLEEAQQIGKIGSWELNIHLNKIERSDEIYRIYELDPLNASASPSDYLTVIHPDDRGKVGIAHADSVRNKKPYQIEYRLLFADGRVKYLSERCETYYDESGNPLRSIGTVQDITEQKQNAQQVELLGFALNNASEAVYICEEKTVNFIYVNDQACRSLGYSREELLGLTIFDIDPNVTEDMLRQIDVDIALGKTSIIETGHKRKDGTVFPVEITNTCYQYNEKTYIMNIVQDITERKRTEEALRSSEAELRSLINAMTDVILVGDSDGRYLKIADTGTSLLYKPTNELFGKTVHDVFPKDQADYFLGCIRQTLDTQKPVNFEYSLLVGDIECWFNATISPMSSDKFLMVARDITEEKQKQHALIKAEEKLKESEHRYREIFNNSHDSISLLEVLEDSRFRILALNDQYLREIGVTREQFVGNTVEQNVSPEDAALVNAKYKHCVDTGTIYEDTIELNMPKGVRTYHSTLIPIHDNTGKVYRLMAVSRDITDELKNKLELEKSRSLLSDAEVIASLGNFYMDFTNEKFHCSKGVYKILGLPFKEDTTESLDVFKFVHAEDVERIKGKLNYAFEARIKFDEIHRIIDNSGTEKVVRTTGRFVTDSSGYELFLGNFHDVSAVHSLKKQVVIGEEKMKILAENSPQGILISSGGAPLFINQSLLDSCGVCSMEEFIKMNPINLIHPGDRGSAMKLSKKILEDRNEEPSSHQLMLRSMGRNGRERIFDLRITVCWMDDKKYIQVLVNDITDEIEREKMMSSMASDSLYISQRNTIISNVKKELDDILENNCSKCNLKPNFRNTLNVLETYSKSETDWGLFNKHFENLHPGFISNLKIICPTLTVNDIKHCACIRLNVDTKETARFFNVSPASIQTARVRLKKKLNLPEAVDLREFIETI